MKIDSTNDALTFINDEKSFMAIFSKGVACLLVWIKNNVFVYK